MYKSWLYFYILGADNKNTQLRVRHHLQTYQKIVSTQE
jgi:hypothetical protein